MSFTGIERMQNLLQHKKTDRIGLYEHYWNDTYKTWLNQGKIKADCNLSQLFGYDMDMCWNFNMVADIDYVNETISETETTITARDGNGAVLRRHKLHDSTPEHVDFRVKCYDDWNEYIKPVLKYDERRINFESYRNKKRECNEDNRFFCWSGIPVFENMHPVCGHEHMLIGMALEPEWIHDMCEIYTSLTISMMETLFSKEGKPDGLFFYEDMGFKERPFMSPDMYKELIMPYHKRLFDFAHSQNLPVIMHSCGFVEPLLPYIVESGIDCLQAIEVKAGMDLLRIHKNFGDKIALMGGIDVRTLVTNDFDIINKELESKIPYVKNGYAYILHTDHSVPKDVTFETYQYFVKRGLELGSYN